MSRAIAAVLVVVVLAGCAGPGTQGDEPTVGTDAPDETPMTDNDYGAEPNNPPNATTAPDGVETTDGEPTANGTETGTGT